ncbi:sporulation protein Cse60 [Streptococcus sp. 27098_8_82]|jgi:hypothetical protein|uniref:sporulation protein Cse60 n=1 Tax=Streptococcus sp. 27098_8_82 TaxID=3003643 RepID=UPI00206D9AA0|nr:MAG TPA: Sporulation protein Cse60 [Caudoviricetes sp.]
MIQVKVFKENTGGDLEWDVNNFFKRNPKAELIDIKFQNAIAETKYGFEERCAAMVIYKETEK